MLMRGMKFGQRWLYVLWIAATLVWNQAGAASSSGLLSSTPQWAVAEEKDTDYVFDFTLQTSDTPDDDQDLVKRDSAFTPFLGHYFDFKTPGLIVVGTSPRETPRYVSASLFAGCLIRGPPANA